MAWKKWKGIVCENCVKNRRKKLVKCAKCANPPHAVNRPRTNSPLSPPFCGYSSFEAQADGALVVCTTGANLSFSWFSQPCAQTFAKKTALFMIIVWWQSRKRTWRRLLPYPVHGERVGRVERRFFYFCMCVHSQMASCPPPPFFFSFFCCFWKVFP